MKSVADLIKRAEAKKSAMQSIIDRKKMSMRRSQNVSLQGMLHATQKHAPRVRREGGLLVIERFDPDRQAYIGAPYDVKTSRIVAARQLREYRKQWKHEIATYKRLLGK